MNFAHSDPALRAVVARWAAPSDRDKLNTLLDRLGADAGGRLDALAATADKNPPVLQQFDRDGERIDRIAYHPPTRNCAEPHTANTDCRHCRIAAACTAGTTSRRTW